MGWFNEDSAQAQAYLKVTNKPRDASLTVGLVSGAAAYEAAKAYEQDVAKNNNRLPSEEAAKEILAKTSAEFVDSVVDTHGLSHIDKEAAKKQAKKEAEEALAKLGGIDPRKIVSKKKLDELRAVALVKQEGYDLFVTPAEDIRALEKLLELSPGTLEGEHIVKMPKGSEHCLQCGRHFSFLEIAYSGTSYHGKQLLKDVLTGKYGYVNNPRPPQAFKCFKCDTTAATVMSSYWCLFYGCEYIGT